MWPPRRYWSAAAEPGPGPAAVRPADLRGTFIRLGALVPYAIASGLGGALIAGTVLGALPGHFGALFAIGTLLVFAVAASAVALQAALGMAAGIGLAIPVSVVLGNPSAGGAYPSSLLPPFWRDIGPWLPPGAGATAVRNAGYFTGHHTTGPLWTLGVHAGGGIVVAVIGSAPVVRRRRRTGAVPAGPAAA